MVRVRVRVASQRSCDVRGRDVKNTPESCLEADFKVGIEIYGVELPLDSVGPCIPRLNASELARTYLGF